MMESGGRERERKKEFFFFLKKEGIKQKRVSLVWLFGV